MPKLYTNPKLLIPVILMAVFAGLTLVTVRYLNEMVHILSSPQLYGGSQDPFFWTYVAEVIGRVTFPLFALVSLVILFTSRSKTMLSIFVGLTALAGFVPALFVSCYLTFAQGWSFLQGFFWVNDWWTGSFDLGLAIYHVATWLVIPVTILYLVLSMIKTKTVAPSAFAAPGVTPAAPAAPQVIVGYDTNTGAPIYGNAPTQN